MPVIFPCVQEVALTQPTLSRPDRQDVTFCNHSYSLHFGTTNAPLETGSVFGCVWGSPSGLRKGGGAVVIRPGSFAVVLSTFLLTVFATGCAGSRTAIKRDARLVIPVKCIYFASPQTKCQPFATGGDLYLCREVLIKTSCIELKK